jgi:hypothetical protein
MSNSRLVNHHNFQLIPLIAVITAVLLVGPVSADEGWLGKKIALAERKSTTIFNSGGFLVCDPYQNLHIFWQEDKGELGNSIYYMNDLAGFLTPALDIYYSTHRINYNSLIATGNNHGLYLLWIDDITWELLFGRADISAAYDARSWQPPVSIADPVYGHNIKSDRWGNLHIIYDKMDTDNIHHSFYYLNSRDNGATWSDPYLVGEKKVPEPSITNISMAIDENGRIFVGIAYRSFDYEEFSELGYFRSKDNGVTWEDYVLFQNTSNGFRGGIDRLAFYTFGPNEVHATFHGPARSHVYSLDGGETWTQPQIITSMGYAFGGDNVLVKDSSGSLYALFASFTGVFLSQYMNNAWTSWEYVDDSPIDAHYQQMVVCQGNQLHIVYSGRIDSTVWYTTRQLNSEPISRQSMDGNLDIGDLGESDGTMPRSEEILSTATISADDLAIPTTGGPQKPVGYPILVSTISVIGLFFLIYLISHSYKKG